MKKTALFIITIGLSSMLMAQEEEKKDLNKKELKQAQEEMIHSRDEFLFPIEMEADSAGPSVEDKLVMIALKNDPDLVISSNNQDIAKYNLQKSKWNWLNMLSVTGNLNEFTLNPNALGQDGNFFYPRYNISLTIPMGVFGTNSADVKMNRKTMENAEAAERGRKIAIRQDVLTLYENYKLMEILIGLQNEKTEDAYTYFKSVEQQFSIQEADIKVFKEASIAYNEELEKKHKLIYQQRSTKVALESYLGMSLEAALIYNIDEL